MACREVGDDSVGPSGRMVGQMRCTVNYDFQNYFLVVKGDVA
jgi:hypothetical protein